MKQKLLLIFYSGIIVLCLSNDALAVGQSNIGDIGVVVSTQGRVIATNREKRQRPLRRGSDIYLYDRIATQEKSKAHLRLKDDSVIVLQPSSEFYVSEFSFSKNAPKNNKYVGNIVKGMLINISGQGDSKNYRLDSPLATIAFRGTGLATQLLFKDNVATDQEIYVFQGNVNVSNRCEYVLDKRCRSKTINLGVGQKINSAMVALTGNIRGFSSSSMATKIGVDGAGTLPEMKVTKTDKGGITITCKRS